MWLTLVLHCNICIPSSFQCVHITTILLFLIGFAEIKHTTDIINMYLHICKCRISGWTMAFSHVSWIALLIAKCSISTNCTHHIMQKIRSLVLQCTSLTNVGYITEQKCYKQRLYAICGYSGERYTNTKTKKMIKFFLSECKFIGCSVNLNNYEEHKWNMK